MNVFNRLVLLLTCLLVNTMHEAVAQLDFKPKTTVQLLFDQQVAKPGTTVTAGFKLKMEGRWHTYWRNPGEVGKPTRIKWQLPDGFSAGEIQWPMPHKVFAWDLGSYEYGGEVILFVPLAIDSAVKAGEYRLAADVDWLECEPDGSCVPGETKVTATLTVGGKPMPSSHVAEFDKWKKQLPAKAPSVKLTAYWKGAPKDDSRTLVLQWPTAAKTNEFYAYHHGNDWYIAPQQKVVSVSGGKVTLEKEVKLYEGSWPTSIAGLVVSLDQDPKHPVGIETTAGIGATKPAMELAKPSSTGLGGLGSLGGLTGSKSSVFGSFGGLTGKSTANSIPKLAFESEVAVPGSTVTAVLTFSIADNWHMYWRNPGSPYGLPPSFKFNLPAGFSVEQSAIRWPLPQKHKYPSLTVDGEFDTSLEYAGEIAFLIPVQIAADAARQTHTIGIDLKWVECETDSTCVSQKQSVSAELTVGDQAKPAAVAGRLADWEAKVPAEQGPAAAAWWNGELATNQRALVIEWDTTAEDADFFPHETNGDWEAAAGTESLPAPTGKARIQTTVTRFEGEWPTSIAGVLVSSDGASKVSARIGEVPAGTGTPLAQAAEAEGKPFIYWLALAFLGGLILNIMPCVLPVISLKILGFVNQANDDPATIRKLGFIYCLGVLVSFLAMALMIIAVQKAGNVASWGMQFGNPVFLVCMLTLVTLVALNLFGVFEVTITGGAMNAAGSLASKHGPAGAFFNGVLATALATPCTAPFLAPALGFAFVQPPSTIIIMFLVVGAGLAVPYLILSMNPKWLRFLPKPGNWMVGFKKAMGFPMLATAIWLLWVATKRFGRDGILWLGLFLVLISLAAWIWGDFVQRGTKRKGLAMAFSLVFLITGYGYALEQKLQWRDAGAITTSGSFETQKKAAPGDIDWQPWSRDAIAAARAAGRPVLVDFTADWCFTCKANKKIAIDIESTRKKLGENNFVTLIADNTAPREDIALELRKYGRAGVPMVLVYPPDPAKEPQLLPTALKPSIVHDAIDKAVY